MTFLYLSKAIKLGVTIEDGLTKWKLLRGWTVENPVNSSLIILNLCFKGFGPSIFLKFGLTLVSNQLTFVVDHLA